MSKKPNMQQVDMKRCENCGELLPVNERGMSVTSVYFNGHWLCPNCKYRKEAIARFK